eukprot:1926907-Amphidinium_carterae.1
MQDVQQYLDLGDGLKAATVSKPSLADGEVRPEVKDGDTVIVDLIGYLDGWNGLVFVRTQDRSGVSEKPVTFKVYEGLGCGSGGFREDWPSKRRELLIIALGLQGGLEPFILVRNSLLMHNEVDRASDKATFQSHRMKEACGAGVFVCCIMLTQHPNEVLGADV